MFVILSTTTVNTTSHKCAWFGLLDQAICPPETSGALIGYKISISAEVQGSSQSQAGSYNPYSYVANVANYSSKNKYLGFIIIETI